ncbi:UNVERIFIED_CONTAM: hypothetical protein O8I53_08325 [Campylobacter lari]
MTDKDIIADLRKVLNLKDVNVDNIYSLTLKKQYNDEKYFSKTRDYN